jgi:hypothetical protein
MNIFKITIYDPPQYNTYFFQLFMVSKTGEAESITSHYLFALGSYRGLYILNWIYRSNTDSRCSSVSRLIPDPDPAF